jgi:hypothetical protein
MVMDVALKRITAINKLKSFKIAVSSAIWPKISVYSACNLSCSTFGLTDSIYRLSPTQVGAILELRLHRLTGLEQDIAPAFSSNETTPPPAHSPASKRSRASAGLAEVLIKSSIWSNRFNLPFITNTSRRNFRITFTPFNRSWTTEIAPAFSSNETTPPPAHSPASKRSRASAGLAEDIIAAFIRHRQEVVTRRTMFELRKARERGHILEAQLLGGDG